MKLKKLLSGITSMALSLSAFAGMSSLPTENFQASAANANWKFDFGAGGVAGGYTGVSAADGYNASRGYGFAQTGNVSNVSASGSNATADAVKFNNYGAGNTFNVDLPKGLYQVTVTVGNSPRTSIKMEGMLQMMNLTGCGATESIQIPVTDGQLNIQAVEGMAGREQSIAALEITQLNTTGEMRPTIWICGDSTVANYYNAADTAQHGWGQFLGNYVDKNTYEIRNMATSGQYAKGFVDGGQFAPIEYYGKPGDYYIISIGINDTNYSNKDEYYNYVSDMVKKAKAKGMTVYLVKQQGRRGDLQRNPKLGGRWFGGQLDTIGQEQNVTVFDLFTPWQDFGLSLGYDAMGEYYAIQANGSADDLHQSKKGSLKLAELMQGMMKIGVKESIYPDEGVSYTFKNVNSNLYMEVKNAAAENAANVQQWGITELGDWNTWKFKKATGDYYYIISNLDNGKYYLDVQDGSKENGGNIDIYEKNGYSTQFFKILDNGDGTVTIVTRASRDACAVEVGSALTNSGANIQQWETNNHNCQKWIMEKVDYPVEKPTEAPTEPPTEAPTQPPMEAPTEPPVIETTVPQTGEKILLGDVNCDGNVTISDAVRILQYLANQEKYPLDGIAKQNADIFEYGSGITARDAAFIQAIDAGVETAPVYEEIVGETTTPPEEIVTTTTTEEVKDPYEGYYFAVDQTWEEGFTETTNSGYTKPEGYVNLDNNDTSNITFNVNVPQDGNYMTHIRFANGSAVDRKMKVYVNGNTETFWEQSFTGTGAWTEWTEFGIVLPLKAGANTIKFLSAVAGQGGPNLDYITLTLTDEPYAEPYDPSQEEQHLDVNNPTIYIAGDSTVQSYRASYAPQQGWGYYLGDYFTDNVNVANHSIAGRSTKKFYDEGRWNAIAENLKRGDYVMIQFAINDSGASNADRYAPTCGNVDNPSAGSYEWYMTEFIKSAQAKEATPILVTTVIGMKAYSNGKFVNSYSNYCDACKNLARKYNIPCIDLNTLMVNHYNSVGYNTALKYHLMGVVEGSTDGTHFCETGANVVAGLVAKAVKDQKISGLSEYVK
ncbi:MAG: RICIN domain-containing protein [Ruminococcus sp.]|nr:RICIN domain-containing protein [Ruminococcus sp.]